MLGMNMNPDMKDPFIRPDGDAGRRGAMLVLASAAAAVVMLSALLLLGYVGRMRSGQTARERAAQAGLTSAGAGEWLAWSLSGRGLQPRDLDGTSFESGGFTTRMDLLSTAPVPPASVTIGEFPAGTAAVASDGSISLLMPSGDSLEVLVFDPSGRRFEQLPPVCAPEGSVIAGTGSGSGYLFAVITAGPEPSVLFTARDGSVTRCAAPAAGSGWTAAEAGLLDGMPAVVLYRAEGPVIAILRNGSLLQGGSALEAALGLDCAGTPVHAGEGPSSIVRCDADMDGADDLAAVSPSRITCFTASGTVFSDSVPGASPAAWGFSRVSSGFVVCWEGASGRTWRRLGWSGFQSIDPVAALSGPSWTGLLHEGCNCVAGDAGGLRIASCASGESMLLAGGRPVFADIDGGPPDAIIWNGGSLSVVLDPVEGEGTGSLWRLSTMEEPGSTRIDTLFIPVYMDGSGALSVRTGGA